MPCPTLVGSFAFGPGLGVEKIALAPDASLIYGLNHGAQEIRRYSYPDLSYQAQEYAASDFIERQAIAIDGDGVLYWVEYIAGTDTSIISKDTGSATALHSETGKFGGWTICWNPHDGLLYVLDTYTFELFTVDTTSGTKTVVATSLSIRGFQASQTCPVPTLDGGIWWERSGTDGPARYDIPTDSVATAATDGTPKQSMLPRPDDAAWTHTSACTYAEGAITKTAHGCTVPGSILSVGYTPTLDRVCYLANISNFDVYELSAVSRRWWAGVAGSG